MWKILKGTIIRKSTDPIKIGRRARSFLYRQNQNVEQVHYFEKLTKFPSNLSIHYDNAPAERGFSLEHLMGGSERHICWTGTPPIHQTFLRMTFVFFKIKIDFERKKILGHRINSGKFDGSLNVIKRVEFQKCLQQ